MSSAYSMTQGAAAPRDAEIGDSSLRLPDMRITACRREILHDDNIKKSDAFVMFAIRLLNCTKFNQSPV